MEWSPEFESLRQNFEIYLNLLPRVILNEENGVVTRAGRDVCICRLCGRNRNFVLPIFSEEAHKKHVLLKIKLRLHLCIFDNDPLPKFACIMCLAKLECLSEFYEDCRKAQVHLRKIFLKRHHGGQDFVRIENVVTSLRSVPQSKFNADSETGDASKCSTEHPRDLSNAILSQQKIISEILKSSCCEELREKDVSIFKQGTRYSKRLRDKVSRKMPVVSETEIKRQKLTISSIGGGGQLEIIVVNVENNRDNAMLSASNLNENVKSSLGSFLDVAISNSPVTEGNGDCQRQKGGNTMVQGSLFGSPVISGHDSKAVESLVKGIEKGEIAVSMSDKLTSDKNLGDTFQQDGNSNSVHRSENNTPTSCILVSDDESQNVVVQSMGEKQNLKDAGHAKELGTAQEGPFNSSVKNMKYVEESGISQVRDCASDCEVVFLHNSEDNIAHIAQESVASAVPLDNAKSTDQQPVEDRRSPQTNSTPAQTQEEGNTDMPIKNSLSRKETNDTSSRQQGEDAVSLLETIDLQLVEDENSPQTNSNPAQTQEEGNNLVRSSSSGNTFQLMDGLSGIATLEESSTDTPIKNSLSTKEANDTYRRQQGEESSTDTPIKNSLSTKEANDTYSRQQGEESSTDTPIKNSLSRKEANDTSSRQQGEDAVSLSEVDAAIDVDYVSDIDKSSDLNLMCYVCDVNFTTKDLLMEHLKQHLQEEKVLSLETSSSKGESSTAVNIDVIGNPLPLHDTSHCDMEQNSGNKLVQEKNSILWNMLADKSNDQPSSNTNVKNLESLGGSEGFSALWHMKYKTCAPNCGEGCPHNSEKDITHQNAQELVATAVLLDKAKSADKQLVEDGNSLQTNSTTTQTREQGNNHIQNSLLGETLGLIESSSGCAGPEQGSTDTPIENSMSEGETEDTSSRQQEEDAGSASDGDTAVDIDCVSGDDSNSEFDLHIVCDDRGVNFPAKNLLREHIVKQHIQLEKVLPTETGTSTVSVDNTSDSPLPWPGTSGSMIVKNLGNKLVQEKSSILWNMLVDKSNQPSSNTNVKNLESMGGSEGFNAMWLMKNKTCTPNCEGVCPRNLEKDVTYKDAQGSLATAVSLDNAESVDKQLEEDGNSPQTNSATTQTHEERNNPIQNSLLGDKLGLIEISSVTAALQQGSTDTSIKNSLSGRETDETFSTQQDNDAVSVSEADLDYVSGNDKSSMCAVCDVIFPSKNLLREHLKQHMQVKKDLSPETSTSRGKSSITVNVDNTTSNPLPMPCASGSVIEQNSENEPVQKRNSVPRNPPVDKSNDQPSAEEDQVLMPSTIEEAKEIIEKYSKIFCDSGGSVPKINMINIKQKMTSGERYGDDSRINYKFLNPFIHLELSKYHCVICKTRSFNKRDQLVDHIGWHLNLHPFCCFHCPKRSTLFSYMNEHFKNCHSSKVLCECCGKSFGKVRISDHMKMHNKTFHCHDCGRRFAFKKFLVSHIMKEHLKIRPYSCSICGKGYYHYNNVATHMIFAHAERKIVCHHCGKMYFRKNMLMEHIKRWHS